MTSGRNGSVKPGPEGNPVKPEVVILGAGPAGLTAAYELSRMGVQCVVLERDSTPGGLARTVEWYRDSAWWWEPIRSGAYRDYYERQYGRALKT